jgi:hypothetical protein
MTMEQKITALAQAVGADIRTLFSLLGTTATHENSWNPRDADAGFAFSDSLGTATYYGGGWGGVRAKFPCPSSGKTYFEISVGSAPAAYFMLGVCSAVAPIVGSYLSSTRNGWEYYAVNGAKVSVSAQNGYGSPFGAGSVIGVAVDTTIGAIWFSVGGVWQSSGDPGAGVNPAFTGIRPDLYPCASCSSIGVALTYHGLPSNQAYAPPIGFSPLG